MQKAKIVLLWRPASSKCAIIAVQKMMSAYDNRHLDPEHLHYFCPADDVAKAMGFSSFLKAPPGEMYEYLVRQGIPPQKLLSEALDETDVFGFFLSEPVLRRVIEHPPTHAVARLEMLPWDEVPTPPGGGHAATIRAAQARPPRRERP